MCSDDQDARHAIEPLILTGEPDQAWQKVRRVLAALPRTRIVEERPDYVHAESRSALFQFVDDIELHYRRADRTVAMRSASRLGYSDLGVNRKRVETLRASLAALGVVQG